MHAIIAATAGRELIYQAVHKPAKQIQTEVIECTNGYKKLIEAWGERESRDIYYDFAQHQCIRNPQEIPPTLSKLSGISWRTVTNDYFYYEFQKIARSLSSDENDRSNIVAYLSNKLDQDLVLSDKQWPARIEKLFRKILDSTMVSAQKKKEKAEPKQALLDKRKLLIEQYMDETLPFNQTPFFKKYAHCTTEDLQKHAQAVQSEGESKLAKAAWEKIFKSWENTTRQTRKELQITFTYDDVDKYVQINSPVFRRHCKQRERQNNIIETLRMLISVRALRRPDPASLLKRIKEIDNEISQIYTSGRLHRTITHDFFVPSGSKVAEEKVASVRTFLLNVFYKHRYLILGIVVLAIASVLFFLRMRLENNSELFLCS